jgi:hypothetical protein
MDDFHRVQDIAHGGYRCPCCGPKPSDRPKARRTARRRLKAVTRRIIRDQIED